MGKKLNMYFFQNVAKDYISGFHCLGAIYLLDSKFLGPRLVRRGSKVEVGEAKRVGW